MIAAIRIPFLVLDYYEEGIWRYDIGSAHGVAKILNHILRFIINQTFWYFFRLLYLHGISILDYWQLP